jgi:hypothetical protein
MRLSSLVSLVVVTASLALGGCAADAEPTSGGTDLPNVALSDPNATVDRQGRVNDVRYTGKVSDEWAQPTDETRVRQVETHTGGVADPRIDVVPSVFGQPPSEKIGVTPPTFRPVNPLELGVRAETGYQPYSHTKKDVP